MTIWQLPTACWIPKATRRYSEYVILIALLQQWLHERASMLRYTYIACILSLFLSHYLSLFLILLIHYIRHFLTF